MDSAITQADNLIEEVTAGIHRRLSDRMGRQEIPSEINASRLAGEAADWIMSAITTATGTSLLARRIGPVYTTDDLSCWLVTPGRPPLTTQAIRKRAKRRQLVGFSTDDKQWAFPAWQFDRAAGRLIPRQEVVSLWQRLPHGAVLTSADLAAWMNTKFASLDGTPAGRADRRGADDAALAAAVSRLWARAA